MKRNELDQSGLILVCSGDDCVKRGAKKLRSALKDAIEKRGLDGEVRVCRTGCLKSCKRGPLALIPRRNLLMSEVKPKDAGEIVDLLLDPGA